MAHLPKPQWQSRLDFQKYKKLSNKRKPFQLCHLPILNFPPNPQQLTRTNCESIILLVSFMFTHSSDLMKITALFCARNGRQFMTQVMTREQRNYQFDFLKPQHSNFPYFTKLVEQYTKVCSCGIVVFCY